MLQINDTMKLLTIRVYCTKHTKSIRIKLFEQDDLLGRGKGVGGGVKREYLFKLATIWYKYWIHVLATFKCLVIFSSSEMILKVGASYYINGLYACSSDLIYNHPLHGLWNIYMYWTGYYMYGLYTYTYNFIYRHSLHGLRSTYICWAG